MRMSGARIPVSRFRGSLVGSLVGDCFGSMYEGMDGEPLSNICKRMTSLLEGKPSQNDKLLEFTDDSAMALGLCESLLEHRRLDVPHLAKTFTTNFFKEPFRGYGPSAPALYCQLRENGFSDVVGPAAGIHGGSGSYGNGGAMRIAPMALFTAESAADNPEQLITLTEKATRVTHTNPKGIAGAVLQSLAVRAALSVENGDVDPAAFIASVRADLKTVDGSGDFMAQLDEMAGALAKKEPSVDKNWVVDRLGTSIVAHRSVGTALYVFLRSLRPVKGIDFENPFVRCIVLAVSLGGDTDTIACMAGAIAGAAFGIEKIPDRLSEVCEAKERMEEYATRLHDFVFAEV